MHVGNYKGSQNLRVIVKVIVDYDYFANVIDYDYIDFSSNVIDYDYIDFSSNVIDYDYDYVIVIVIMSTITITDCNYPMSDAYYSNYISFLYIVE